MQDVMQGPACNGAGTPAAAEAAAGAAGGESKGAKKRLRKKQAKAAAALQAAGVSLAQQAAAVGAEWGVSEEQKLRKARALSSLGEWPCLLAASALPATSS